MVRLGAGTGLVLVFGGIAAAAETAAQTPKPFPRPGETRTQASRPADVRQPQPPPTASAPTPAAGQLAPAVASAPPAQAADLNAPRPEDVVFPIYPASQFLASYDAGRGQRYLLYGTTAGFADIVAFYRMQLGDKGDFVFREPPTHVFEVGRFREETMAFPPGVTVKDWTWGGSQGYPNPKLGAQPARYPTIIMIVPPPPAAAAPAKR
jgi:hypothetical protein